MSANISASSYKQLEQKSKSDKYVIKMVFVFCVNTVCFLFYISTICDDCNFIKNNARN